MGSPGTENRPGNSTIQRLSRKLQNQRRATPSSEVLLWLMGIGASRGLVRVGAAVVVQFCLGDAEVGFRGMIGVSGELAMELEGTDLRCILIPHTMGHKGFVCNGQREFARLTRCFPYGEGVLAGQGFGLKA